MDDLFCKTLRRFVVMLFAVFDFRQTGVRQNRHGNFGMFAQIFHGFRHLFRSRAAIHPDHVNRKRFERSQSRADLRPVEHRPESLDRNLRDDRNFDFSFLEKFKNRHQSRLRLQQILTSFDNKQIRTAVIKPANLLVISRFQITKRNMPERRQFRPRTNRTGDKTRFFIRRIIIRQTLRHLRRFEVDIVSFFDNPELRQNDFRTAETVRFDDINARFQKIAVNDLNRLRLRIKQIFRAILKILPAPIFNRKLLRLQTAAHRAVENDDFFF